MFRRTSSTRTLVCLSALGALAAASALAGCSSSGSNRVARGNQHRAFRLSSGDAVGMQILRNDPEYSAAGPAAPSVVSAEPDPQGSK